MGEQEQWDIVSGVGLTALAAAAGRAVETSRADRLIDDPYAAALVTAARSPVPLPLRWPEAGAQPSDQELLLLYGAGYVGLRSRFFDDYLRRVAADGPNADGPNADGAGADGPAQVVVLAAGLDVRAFRLDWPAGTRLFELDHPAVLEFKDAVLREVGAPARCARTTVGVDLREGWADALTAAGFDARLRTVWVAEGLLQYLPAGAERALFERIDDLSAPGSHLAVERSANLAALLEGADGQRLREVGDRTGIPVDRLISGDARPDPAAWLSGRGWSVTEEPVLAVAERYHRDLADPGLPRPTRLDRPAEPDRPAGPTAGATAASPGPAGPPTATSFLCARRGGRSRT